MKNYFKIFQKKKIRNILKNKKITKCIKIQPSSSKIESRLKKLVKSCDLKWVKAGPSGLRKFVAYCEG